MKKAWGLLPVLAVTLFLAAVPVRGQTVAAAKKESPQWAKDLRRAEIVFFGAFPFTWFNTTFWLDVYRSSQHDWDSKYYPWPLKPAGAIDKTTDEYFLSIYISAALCVGISLVDQIIIHTRRAREAKRNEQYPEGDPIIIRRPLFEDEADAEHPAETEHPAEAAPPDSGGRP
jgi:hypothetical protein